MPWVRSGECNRCGDCCKGNPFTSDDDDTVYCPLFSWINKGVGERIGNCTDRQHPYYLNGCIDFPQHPRQIEDKPNCSYTFDIVR